MSFRINRVYTRSGDGGETGLVGGARVKKNHPRLSLVGDIDELNSVFGLIAEKLVEQSSGLKPLVLYLQQELFDLGSEIATPLVDYYPGMWHVGNQHVDYLEYLCDYFGENLPELTSFILPGGSEIVSLIHVARAITRRAERELVGLQQVTLSRQADGDRGDTLSFSMSGNEIVPDAGCLTSSELLLPLKYLNRLSDLLFILARWALKAHGLPEVMWSKGEERQRPVLPTA